MKPVNGQLLKPKYGLKWLNYFGCHFHSVLLVQALVIYFVILFIHLIFICDIK